MVFMGTIQHHPTIATNGRPYRALPSRHPIPSHPIPPHPIPSHPIRNTQERLFFRVGAQPL